MAKELPYFKFEPSEWENGNIQMCSREDKGLFMDLCSMYWSRLGDLPIKLAIQKLCGGNATAFDSLIQEEIFTVVDGYVCINFLNEQLQMFENIREQNSKNAKSSWEKRRKQKESSDRNATALNPQSENDAIREDKKREKNIFVTPSIEEIKAYCEERQNDVDANKFFNFYESKGWLVGKSKMKDWKASVRTWEKDSKESPKDQKKSVEQLTYEHVQKQLGFL